MKTKIIRQVYLTGRTKGSKTITIPKNSEIQPGDFVEVRKVIFKPEEATAQS